MATLSDGLGSSGMSKEEIYFQEQLDAFRRTLARATELSAANDGQRVDLRRGWKSQLQAQASGDIT